MNRICILALFASLPIISLSSCKCSNTTRSNPLMTASTLQFQAPPFDKIKDEDYKPAIEEGMRQQLAEVEAIANQSATATFENTILAMEKSGELLTRATRVFDAVTAANLNDALEKVRDELAPKRAAHNDAIYLNAKLYARVKALPRESLDSESAWVLHKYERDFVRAGANLNEQDQTSLKALNKEESTLSTNFQNKLLAGTKEGALVVGSKDELAGLSDAELASAAEAAKARKLDGQYLLALQNTTQQPSQSELQNRATREKLFKASIERTERSDKNDTRATIQRLAQLRAEKAKLLGFSSWSAYALDDQMAKKPETAIKFMTDMVPAAIKKAEGEAAKMQALVDKSGSAFKLEPWDWQYYAEQVRKAEYDLDESAIKPYFEINRVLKDGVFFAANKLYGITFKERKDLPVYHPDVTAFEVFDKDGSSLALWYRDPFKRDGKQGGAWMDALVNQSDLLGLHPVIYNVTNFTKPAAGEPALLTFGEVTTMFHEFGHALHGMFSKVKYPRVSGTNTPRDFVEFPSQFNEHWASEPTVFANYAKHYKTGEPMPQEMVERIKRVKTFNQGFGTVEYLAAALLDQAWHELPVSSELKDVDAFEAEALAKFNVKYALVPPRYRTSYFNHIWGGGYSAGYYAYLWSEVLDDDAFYWFKDHGGMTRENGQRYRDMILSKGSTQEMDALYRAFRGRDPEVQPLLIERGLVEEAPKT
jgi:peptidyl-dipeptidase Dcp